MTSHQRRLSLALLISSSVLGLAAPALAQTAAAQPPSSATAPGASAQVEEVVVTANRRSESVQAVPGQVSAVTGGDLQQINAHSLEDFAAYVPGLSISPGPGTSLIAIRGITTGTQLSSAIGLYLDDIPLGSSTSFALGANSFNVNAFDLNRVEVLNGPQGTLYGANALGGTLKYITAAPDPRGYSAAGEAEVSSTEHGGINDSLRGMVNIPIANGLGALRVDALDEYDSGYTHDPVYHRDNQGRLRTEGGRASLLLDPTDKLEVRLSGFYQRADGESADVAFRDPVTHAPTYGKYDQAYPILQPGMSSVSVFSGTVSYDLPFAKLTSITGYQNNHGVSDTDESLVYDPALAAFGAGGDPFDLFVNTWTKKFTQEVRLVSHDSTRFQWLVGGFYNNERTNEVVNLYDNANPGGTLFGLPLFISDLPSTYREYAVYGDGTVFLTSRFNIGFGVRYSNQHQTYDETVTGLLATGSNATFTPPVARSNQDVATYLINPKFQVTDNTMVYARVASGFRPGGPNFVLAPGLGNPTFDPDKLWNYEIGEKSTFLDNRLTLNVDAYDIEWKSIQVTVNNGGVNQLENAGNARVQGGEASFSYRVAPSFTFAGSAAYTDARLVTTAPVLGITTTGARLPLSAKFNFALLGTYNFDIGAGFSGALTVTDRYLGERNAGFGTAVSPLYRLGAFNTVDADLAIYTPHNAEVDLFVRNVFNVAGETYAVTIANEYNPASPVPVGLSQPRTVGATLRLKIG